MTATMMMAARDVEGMYWKRELRTASARRTMLPANTAKIDTHTHISITYILHALTILIVSIMKPSLINNDYFSTILDLMTFA